MIWNWLIFQKNFLLRFAKADKLARGNPALMQILIKTVLAISARFPKIDNSGLLLKCVSINSNSFSIAFHINLLNMRN